MRSNQHRTAHVMNHPNIVEALDAERRSLRRWRLLKNVVHWIVFALVALGLTIAAFEAFAGCITNSAGTVHKIKGRADYVAPFFSGSLDRWTVANEGGKCYAYDPHGNVYAGIRWGGITNTASRFAMKCVWNGFRVEVSSTDWHITEGPTDHRSGTTWGRFCQ